MAKERKITLLLVEDDQASIDILSSVLSLKYRDVSICTAHNGKTGLQSFKDYLPSIVITDVNMPEMDGIRMVSEILSIKSDTKIIFLTACDITHILQSDINGVKFDHHIAKPVNCTCLFAAVDTCIQTLT